MIPRQLYEGTPVAKRASNADLMREWRKLAGLSREQAGERIGLGAAAIRDIEQGLRRDGDRLTEIALKKLIADAK
jgi:transcriptional regulator with XRE-family HTH domain